MSSNRFSDDFKRDAVAQITERGYPVREVSARLGVSQFASTHGRGSSREPARAKRIRTRRSVG